MTQWAARGDVEAAVQRWSPAQIECRTYGHTWRSRTVHHQPGIYTITQRCSRCRNERQQDIDEQGDVITGWRHTYRSGYLLQGLGRVGSESRSVLRLATLDGLQIIEVDPEEDG